MARRREIEVPQGESAVHERIGELSTLGLGPCIGVAIGYQDVVALLHGEVLGSEIEGLDSFLVKIGSRIMPDARMQVHPVVAGGEVESAEDENLKAREQLLRRLTEEGYGEPNVRWNAHGPLGASHSLRIECEEKQIVLTTSDIDGMGDVEEQEELFKYL